jgi:hypothetical protein
MNWKQKVKSEKINVEVLQMGTEVNKDQPNLFRAWILVGDIHSIKNFYFTSDEGTIEQKLDRCLEQAVSDFLMEEEAPTLPLPEVKDEKPAAVKKTRTAKPKGEVVAAPVVAAPVVAAPVVAAPVVAAPVVAAPVVAAPVVAGIVEYDNKNKAHTTAILAILNKDFPNWKADKAIPPKISATSQKLATAKAPFLSPTGEVLETFKSVFLKEIGLKA